MVNNLQQEVSRAVEHFYQSVLSESHSNDDELSVVLPVIITCYNMILTDRVDDFYRLQRANEDEVEATLLDELQQLSNQHPGYEEWVSIVREDIKRFSSSKYPNACYLIYVTVNTLSSLSFDEWCLNKEHCGGLFFDHLLVTIFNNVGVSSAEFYNSPPIAKLVALLADSDRGMSLYDPTCGVGSFLLSSAKGDCELYGQS